MKAIELNGEAMKHFRYSIFELLVLIFGAGTLFALVFMSPRQATVELIAQLLLVPIFVGILHYGEKGGIATFLFAAAVYLVMRAPDLMKMGLIAPIMQLILLRVLVYGIVGIGGGIICSRIKYFFARLEQLGFIDEVTGLYNADYLGQLIERYAQGFERYGSVFSVVTIGIESKPDERPKRAAFGRELRGVGLSIRDSIRAVDEVGRISDAAFGLILPNTNASGAVIASERLQKLTANCLRKQSRLAEGRLSKADPEINVDIYEYPKDEESLKGLLKSLGLNALSAKSGSKNNRLKLVK